MDIYLAIIKTTHRHKEFRIVKANTIEDAELKIKKKFPNYHVLEIYKAIE